MNKIFKNKFVILGIVIIIIAVVLFIIFTGGKHFDSQMKYEGYTVLKGHSGKIEKYDSSNAVEGYKGGKEAYYISGKIVSDKDVEFVIVTFNLYDKSDKLLGTAVSGLKDLKKDKSYDFKAVSLMEYEKINLVDHYDLKSVE